MIYLKEIIEENFSECIHLKVAEAQKSFVASNVYSLAQAWLYPENARPFAIYSNDLMVGFLMIDIDYNCGSTKNACWLWRLMIDEKYQGQGYGKAAMQELIHYVKNVLKAKMFETSIVHGNETAEKLYGSLGFIRNGELECEHTLGKSLVYLFAWLVRQRK